MYPQVSYTESVSFSASKAIAIGEIGGVWNWGIGAPRADAAALRNL